MKPKRLFFVPPTSPPASPLTSRGAALRLRVPGASRSRYFHDSRYIPYRFFSTHTQLYQMVSRRLVLCTAVTYTVSWFKGQQVRASTCVNSFLAHGRLPGYPSVIEHLTHVLFTYTQCLNVSRDRCSRPTPAAE